MWGLVELIRKIIKWLVFRMIYPCCYRLAAVRALKKNKVIFVENHEEQLTDNFILVYEELKKRNYDIRVHYLKVATSGWRDIIRRSITLISDIGDAGYIFLNESNSLFGSFRLRSETQMIQLWHACGAFKKWGFSVADKSFGDDERTLKKYSGHRNYTLMAVSGDEVCWAYEEAFGLESRGVVKPIGVSRTDMFFDEERKKNAYEKIRNLSIDTRGKRVIVYLPTFRGSIAKAKGPDEFDVSELELLRDKYVILIKNHPFVKERFSIPYEAEDYCMEIKDEMTVEDMLIAADVCITDYSSVIFEYSMLDKPIIFYAYDIDAYDMERGFYYKYEDFVPGPIAFSMNELKNILVNVEEFDYDRLEAFRKRFMNGCDGHATDRLLKTIGIN